MLFVIKKIVKTLKKRTYSSINIGIQNNKQNTILIHLKYNRFYSLATMMKFVDFLMSV